MELKKITEVGIAVKDMEKTTQLFVNLLGGEAGNVIDVPLFGMRFRMVKLANIEFEIMEPTDEKGLIAKFIRGRGEGLHHLAFAVDDLADRLSFLKQQGCQLINESPLDILGGKVGFVHPKAFSGVMFELIQYPRGYEFPDGDINT
ncbi:MAG: VOC family protein [Deltaproteobacteria bacterium]|nr:VOC family protein [Deltaproteobacteria bacterium]